MCITGSLPVRGEWIEMHQSLSSLRNVMRSLPVRGEWIEMYL